MSPAQSEDSGLAADRGTTYATISLPRDNVQAMMGILMLGELAMVVIQWLLQEEVGLWMGDFREKIIIYDLRGEIQKYENVVAKLDYGDRNYCLDASHIS